MPIDPKNIAPLESKGNIVGLPKDNQAISVVSYDIFSESETGGVSNAIGFISNISDAYSRTNTRQRHLSSTDAGRIIEITPGLENITLNVTGFNLYNTSHTDRDALINRLTGNDAMYNLSQNKEYFAILKTVKHPNPSADIQNEITGVLFRRCLLASFNDVADINTITSASSATIDVSFVEPYEGD